MRWSFQCGAHNLEDGLTDHHESDGCDVECSANAQHSKEESEKREWSNNKKRREVDWLRPVPLNRPGESRRRDK